LAASSEQAAVLGVERSVTDRRWRARLADEGLAQAVTRRLSLPEIVGRVLAARGVDAAAAEGFLNPTLRAHLPDPAHLLGMDDAVARLVQAIDRREPICVFGDYDVDGATSAALLVTYLRAVGAEATAYIPDRMAEGYGPNLPALLRLRDQGVRVVVTVDCGTLAHEPMAGAAAAGLDAIIIDHHKAEAELPAAIAVVNPNRLDETSPHRQLAAVGVSFLLVVALNRALRAAGRFRARPEPDLMEFLDLVALGTVCDVVPLTGVNRALVSQGLKVASRRARIGLAALAEVARADKDCTAYHMGFVLGPRVNAGGRVGAADLGFRLLSTGDAEEARGIAHRLDLLNRERQTIESGVLEAARARADAFAADGGAVVVAGEGWHPGVIGIVASRLKEVYGRPVCVVAVADGVGKGSGRSVEGFDLGAVVIDARRAGMLQAGGGHAMAAGFTVAAERVAEFAAFLNVRYAPFAAAQPRAQLGIDGTLACRGATPELIDTLARVAPYGAGNAEPRFAFPAVSVVRADPVGERHVRCILTDMAGGRLTAIAFRARGTALGPALLGARGAPLHVAGHLRADVWQGERRVQLVLEDAAQA